MRLGAAWTLYRITGLRDSAGPLEEATARRAFYGGAASVLAVLKSHSSGGTDAKIMTLRLLMLELEAFEAKVLAGQA